jgi:hypothetical protein
MNDDLQRLQQRIERLEAAVGEIRDRLAHCIQVASYPLDAIALARGVAESLAKRILENIGIRPPAMLDACLRELEKPEVMSRVLVPSEIITLLHMVRVMGNKAIHDSMRIQLTTGDVYLVLQSLLRVIEWYFSEFEHGPKIDPLFCKVAETSAPQEEPLPVSATARLRSFVDTLAGPRSRRRPPPMACFIREKDRSARVTRVLKNRALIRNCRKWPTP